ncbi:hypothetical protein TTHERM_00127030 (macronuclear) [Tetrahymena thermophila SB210]|uniref:Transmembrane protein n=1 Tax=Tetrahymena thermophila (strain SB210) TaxID=312017 RepID=I7LUU0_TETTS|nr:hypothetical protein TTHERM_00127030 [Tetrahymena thermophila SB210]EAR96038.2 hypothetical protein TTHERM_00127030 [Tetrahymena thermophila SB210]|eukprot:XP_001016283.2 hypothetical protein TTHERM_00127030 [Tetrahymena thermophila SB210]
MYKRINDRLMLLYIALIVLALVGQGNCFSLQEPTQFLKQKLDSKIDINPYFLDIFEKQQQNNEYICSYKEGPYCSLLSNATHDIVEDNFYSKNMRNFLKQQMYELHRQIESFQIKQTNFLPSQYYLDKSRALLDEELFYKPVEKDFPYKLLADFNILEAIESQQNQELKAFYTINLNSGQQIVSTTRQQSSEYLQLQFTDFYFFYPKKQTANTQTQYLDRLDQLISVPSDAYILTNEKPGKIEFNLKVKIISFYAKINPAYTKYEKLTAQMKGYDFIKKENFSVTLSALQNQFKLYKVEANHKVNSISFSPYVIIDNIVVHIDKSDVADANKYPAIDVNNSSREMKDIIESFDKEIFVYTNQKSSSKGLSNDHQLKKGVRLTREERKKQQKETIQKIKEQIPNQIQEKLYKQVEQQPLFDERKIIDELQQILKKYTDAQDVLTKQKINNKQKQKKQDEENTINELSESNQNQFDQQAEKSDLDKANKQNQSDQKSGKQFNEKSKQQKATKNKDQSSTESNNQKQTNGNKYDKKLLNNFSEELLDLYYDANLKVYEGLRTKQPSVFGKLSNQQIEQKIQGGQYNDLLLEVIEESLPNIENEVNSKLSNMKQTEQDKKQENDTFETIQKMYDSFRKKQPSVFGQLSDEQIQQKLEEGGYEELILDHIKEGLDDILFSKQIDNSSSSSQKIQDDKSEKNYFKEALDIVQESTQKIYDSLRKKQPSVFGKLTNKQIDQKILEGGYDELLREIVQENQEQLDTKTLLIIFSYQNQKYFKESVDKFQESASKIYDNLRKKDPSVFGKLTNLQIVQKMKEGGYDELLREIAKENLQDIANEESNKAANKQKRTAAQDSSTSQKIQDDQSEKNVKQSQKQNNMKQTQKDKEQEKDLFNGLYNLIEENTQKIYDSFRKKLPSVFGELSNLQIEKKIYEGGYEELLRETTKEILQELEDQVANMQKRTSAQQRASSQKLRDDQSKQNLKQSQKENNMKQTQKDKEQENFTKDIFDIVQSRYLQVYDALRKKKPSVFGNLSNMQIQQKLQEEQYKELLNEVFDETYRENQNKEQNKLSNKQK